jgi:hypothetical protein
MIILKCKPYYLREIVEAVLAQALQIIDNLFFDFTVLLAAYNSKTLAVRKHMLLNFPTRWEPLRNVSKSY